MLIKKATDKGEDLETLRSLIGRPEISSDVRKSIEREIRNIQSGMRGEAEAAYEMEFHYGSSKNWMIVHDLRLECDGRVAQIDHLLVNRCLDIYVCESKRFSEGVAVNEQGEFSAFFGGKPYGVPSPLEQNRRHMMVLEEIFRSGQVKPPTRLGIAIRPALHGVVLVSKTARITRPKSQVEGIDSIIKNDQLKAKIDRDFDKENNIFAVAKIVGQDTLEDFVRRLAAAHRPISFNWPARFGLSAISPLDIDISVVVESQTNETTRTVGSVDAPQKDISTSKLACASCGTVVAYKVAKFCWFNKSRYGGNVYCFDCQKGVPAA